MGRWTTKWWRGYYSPPRGRGPAGRGGYIVLRHSFIITTIPDYPPPATRTPPRGENTSKVLETKCTETVAVYAQTRRVERTCSLEKNTPDNQGIFLKGNCLFCYTEHSLTELGVVLNVGGAVARTVVRATDRIVVVVVKDPRRGRDR